MIDNLQKNDRECTLYSAFPIFFAEYKDKKNMGLHTFLRQYRTVWVYRFTENACSVTISVVTPLRQLP